MRAPAPIPTAMAVLVFFLVFFGAQAARAAGGGDPKRGVAVLVRKGCTSCHSTDGTPRSGPTFRGLYGSKRTVVTAGSTREVAADDDYLARAVRDPDADVVVGFPRGVMPKLQLTDDETASVARALEQLDHPEAFPGAGPLSPLSAEKSSSAMLLLALSGAWFVGLHLLLSSIPVRKKLIAVLKPGGFSGVYSLAATIGLVGIIFFFRSAPYVEVWLPPRALRWAPVLAMPIAILFMVAGFSTKSPTSVGQGAVASDDDVAKGILTVTRHPALCGFALWASAHLLANGELRAIIVFVSILTLAVAGMVHIDRRRAVELGDAWASYRDRTSLVPFGAVLRGTTKLDLRGIGIVRVLAAALVYVAILHTHALLIGASPMP
jgi:uncharacterized membrane protein/mono/diheme cytochrome c family protein